MTVKNQTEQPIARRRPLTSNPGPKDQTRGAGTARQVVVAAKRLPPTPERQMGGGGTALSLTTESEDLEERRQTHCLNWESEQGKGTRSQTPKPPQRPPPPLAKRKEGEGGPSENPRDGHPPPPRPGTFLRRRG